ncbi:hypothetical protein [Streptomyces sp. NPDC003032]
MITDLPRGRDDEDNTYMKTTFWSRRRVLSVLAATTAVAASPGALTSLARAVEGDAPDPLALPDSDRAKAVKAWITGGRATRAAAADVLVGTDADIRTFLTEQLPQTTAEDSRVAVLTYLTNAGKGMRREATAALDSGDAAIAAFVKDGFKPVIIEDLQVATASVVSNSGKAVQRAGSAAMTEGNRKALEVFLTDEQFSADAEDMRVEVTKLLTSAGPEVTKYANRALSGTDEDVLWFLDTGQHIARARDQESATIDELVKVVEREGKRAKAKTELAVEASERAQTAAQKAKEAAEKAAAEAKKAEEDVAKSAAAARKAAKASRGAADAARTAIRASQAAVDASRRASWAATAASQAAASAGSAASRAYNAAIAASKDASKTNAAKNAAVAARNAAAQARSAAKAADQAAIASAQAANAGTAAASAARNAAAAAKASAQAATSAGKAQKEAAEAKRQAEIASKAANQATNAASSAQTLANAAADAAREARDAANSAAAHADKAADAAEEAVKHAGKAIDYANKSTAHAAEAVKAANVATKIVEKAVKVEQKAREAEMASLEEDRKQGLEEAAELARIEEEELADLQNKRTQAEQTSKAIKDLIAGAEAALASNDLEQAAVLGRKAAIGLLDSRGPWTRQAAQFALSGSDDDVHAWIDTDRVIAAGQDDRETILYIAQVSDPAVADAAVKALESGSSKVEGDFGTSGVIKAREDENRVLIFRILEGKPGKAVTTAANNALKIGTPEALQKFFDHDLAEAVREDDAVTTATITASGGPYAEAYADVAMAGPTWMRRRFVDIVQYQAAQLDFDSAGHSAAIRATIAASAKIAHQAQKNAALASKAAADARDAANDAADWANKAIDSATKAASSATEAKKNADAADKSAADAQASANKAKAAAATARGASRAANFSANKAIDSARSALNSSYRAQASAAAARQSELAAGRDRAIAAAAASDARRIAVHKRAAEIVEAARKAAENARQNKKDKHNPADSPTHDQVNQSVISTGAEEWWNDAGWWADVFNNTSAATGLLATGLGGISLLFPPAAPATAPVALVLGGVSLATAGIGAIFSGIEHGFGSAEFIQGAGSTALGIVTRGGSRGIGLVKKVPKALDKVTDFAGDVASPIGRALSSIG